MEESPSPPPVNTESGLSKHKRPHFFPLAVYQPGLPLPPLAIKNLSLSLFHVDPQQVMAELVHPAHDYTAVVLCALLTFGLLANLYLAVRCFCNKKGQRTKVRIHLFHVLLANLIICLFAIPMDIGWRYTVEWRGGNIGCKILQFAKVLGLYGLSHNLTAIAVDKVVEVRMLMMGGYRQQRCTGWIFAAAWTSSVICSFPQLLVFQTGYSEYSPSVMQCVGGDSFASQGSEDLYTVFMLLFMFGIPWTVMLICFLYIYRIVKSAHDLPEDVEQYALTLSIQQESTSSSSGPQTRTRVFSLGQQSRTSVLSTWGIPHYPVSINQHPMSASLDGTTGDVTYVTSNIIHLRSSEGNFILLNDSFERDLKIFSTVAATTVLTCLPYVAFTVWYLVDSQSHGAVHPIVQELPFVLILSNILLIPAIYALKLCVTS
ncbi:putative Gonadotropin-releasing hormone receptor [Hypsibius exemplaris]|uniref:Gonadotropin-releasing hormone receptor n=1 Tax=Hypsibius exemplaris TaxID=2072580 RepID=A0A1W0X8R0_HYPEX|nr:putative Gonadotropin-releasing hormone receptor [Hypsibius exemplaris]